jgi:hypothetical protein
MKSSASVSRTFLTFLMASFSAPWPTFLACGLLACLLVLSPIGRAAAQIAPDAPPALSLSVAPEPVIQAILAQVDTDSVRASVGDLSGEWPVTIDGSSFQFINRYSLNPVSMEKATQYAYERLQGLGLNVSYHEFPFYNTTLRNVIGEQPGRVHPEQIFLITAHLDSITPSSIADPDAPAPGADDNASGSTGVLIAAELLSQFDFDYTLRYALFTGEEQGVGGSYAYARDSYLKKENILGVLNLDMIAYNSDGLPNLDLHTRNNEAGDAAIANLFVDVVGAYDLDLVPEIFNDGMGRSDHASFWEFDFPAILAIEDDDDFTPYYHSANDKLSSLNLDYFAEFVRAALASLAHMGGLLVGYADGVVRDAPSNQPLVDAIVSVQYDASLLLSTISSASGDFSLSLPPGSYTVNATAPNHVPLAVPGVNILAGQSTSLDIALQTCQHLDGVIVSFAPAEPIVGQTVTLTASLTAAAASSVNYTWDFGDGSATVSGPELTSIAHVFTPQARDQVYQVSVSAFNDCYIPVEAISPVLVLAYKQYLPLAASTFSPNGLARLVSP